MTNVDLSEFFGIPSRSFLGFVLGGMTVMGYYATGLLLPYRYWRKYRPHRMARLSWVRYATIMFLLLTMLALPIKMILRLTLNLKYFWVTPWFNV